ncbi:uncharacterized protein LOC117644222 [Thrips palmi]|uniref:Regulatory protein zeste n=1 Tax=Thrips palmi TaxID=161013 RepID=A0A6P8YYN2_THRPL|nr:uncharacterized protein LOC117644222 [Thrips palmi]
MAPRKLTEEQRERKRERARQLYREKRDKKFDYFDGRVVNIYAEHRRRVLMQINDRFRLRAIHDPLNNMSIPEFIRNYRMPQDDVVHLLNIIHPYVQRRTSPNQIPLITKLLVTLSLYANGSYQRILGKSIDVAVSQSDTCVESSVSRFVREITDALNHPDVLTRFIRFPLTAEERAPIIARNERLGLPRVLGLIDGTLVRLSQLPHDIERQAFFSRKGFLALNVQVICDSDLNIMNVDARFPGSCNDTYVWNASAARPIVEQAYWEDRCWLLGDSGYFTAPWLHTPLPHAERGTPEFYYTQVHCHCRNRVERCIGILKGRFRILGCDRCIHYKDAAFAGNIVNACCVLHNFCNQRGIYQPPPFNDILGNDDYVPDDDENDLPLDIVMRGNAARGRKAPRGAKAPTAAKAAKGKALKSLRALKAPQAVRPLQGSVANVAKENKPGKASYAQWKALMLAVSNDVELLHGEFTGPLGAVSVQNKWEAIAATCNSIPGGANRNGTLWKKGWTKLKGIARKAYAEKAKYMGGTGGGPAPELVGLGLKPLHVDVMKLTGIKAAVGTGAQNPLQVPS